MARGRSRKHAHVRTDTILMKQVLLLVLIIAGNQSFGQTSERLWETGKLTWDDFQGEPFFSSSNASELNYQLSYSTTKKKVNDTTLLVFQTKNSIKPNLSWVKAAYKTEALLRYNQVLFNILELHRRRLQKTLHRIENIYMAEEKFRTLYEACNYEIRRFQEETNLGTDIAALESWENRMEKELEATPYELIPAITDRRFGYGFNVGFGSGTFTRTLADHFTPTFNVVYGFDIAFKNTILFLNATLAGNKVTSTFTEDELIWPADIKTRVAILDISLGQTILDNAKHKLTPFMGFGILEFSAASGGEDFEDHRIVDYGLIYGVNYNFKFRKAIRLTPPPFFGNFREKAEHNIRARIYATSGNFNELKGMSINLTLGYALFGKLITIEG